MLGNILETNCCKRTNWWDCKNFFKVKFSWGTDGSVLMDTNFPSHILKPAEDKDAECFHLIFLLSSSMLNINTNLIWFKTQAAPFNFTFSSSVWTTEKMPYSPTVFTDFILHLTKCKCGEDYFLTCYHPNKNCSMNSETKTRRLTFWPWQSAVGVKHAAKKKNSNPGGCIFMLLQAGPFPQKGWRERLQFL